MMTDKEQMSFSVLKLSPLVISLNKKIRELYKNGGKCYISLLRDKTLLGKAPVIDVSVSDPEPNRNMQIL
jgi:hypothetical protein